MSSINRGDGVEPPQYDPVQDIKLSVEEGEFSREEVELSMEDITPPESISFAKKAAKAGSKFLGTALAVAGFTIGGLGLLIGATITAAVFTVDSIFMIVVFHQGVGSGNPFLVGGRLFSGIGYHAGRATALMFGAIGAKMQEAGGNLQTAKGGSKSKWLDSNPFIQLNRLEKYADQILRIPSMSILFLDSKKVDTSEKDPYKEEGESSSAPDYSMEVRRSGANLKFKVQDEEEDSVEMKVFDKELDKEEDSPLTPDYSAEDRKGAADLNSDEWEEKKDSS